MLIVLDEAYRPGVGNRFDGHEVRFFPSTVREPAVLAEAVAGADVIGFRRVLPFPFTSELVAGAPDLQFIHRSGSGADWFDLPYLNARGVLVALNTGFNAPSVAEHALTLTLLCLRRSLDFIDSMRDGKWLRDLPGPSPFLLNGRTVGVIGVGAIGSRVVRAMLGFDTRVLCYQRDRSITLPEGARWAELDEMFAEADVISLHVPLIEETYHLIDERALSLMKPTAVLINTSRGPVVDQAALMQALRAGRIRAAGLDVFEDEPLAADHPLRRLPNVVTTPHVGGAGVEIEHRQVEGTLANIDRFVAGRTPERLVNPEILADGRARARHLVG